MLLGFVLALFLLTQTAFGAEGESLAVDPVEESDNYSAVMYDNTNGLPTSEANAIAQTSEGFIWIGSYGGLIRYDGNTFERMDSTTGIGSVVSLHVDSTDRLWIGTNESGLALMDRGEIRFWKEEDGLTSSKVCTIEEDENGIIYVGTTSGLYMVYPDMSMKSFDHPNISKAYIEHIIRGKDGLLYCTTNEDDYFILRDGKLVAYTDHSNASIQGITSLLPDPDSPGEVYVGAEGAVVYHGYLENNPELMEPTDISPLSSVIYMQKFGDQLWICARNGIGMIDSRGFHHLSDLPLNNSIAQVMADYEGNLWFVSLRQGVMKLVSNHFSDIFERYGLPESIVNSTCMYEGKLFIGTDTGLMVLDEESQVSEIPLTEAKTASGKDLEAKDLLSLLEGCRIRSVIQDSQGNLWISTWRGVGLLRYAQGKVTAFTEEDGLLSDHIRAICETFDGSILVANTGGVSVIKGDRVTAGYTKVDGIDNMETLTVASAHNGDIILGSNGDGIYVLGEKGTRCISTKDGLTSGIVMRIKHDPDRHIFWIVTSNSLAYMTEDYEVTTIEKFPYSNNFDLYENSKGDMWVLSSNGIYVLPADDLLANDEMNPVHYGIANGLPCITTSNSYSALTEDGDLFIAGNSGVAKVNIDTPLENINDLKQAVPYLEADGTMFYPDGEGNFTLPSTVKKLTVYGYVFNYSLTDPQVSYQLEGFDQAPVTVRRSELDPVSYTNLRGGTYHFVMDLKDAMGRGSKTLSVRISKEKALYEKPWFYLLIGLCAIVFFGALIQRYVRKKMHALEQKHREEAEQERISSELHMANRIQTSTLPHDFPPFPDRKEFDLYAVMEPARQVGGDFYDFFLIDDDHLCLVIADVSGKGIPAALFMMVSKAIIKSFAAMGQSAGQILTKTNERLCANNQLDMFVTVWLGILEISTGKLTAANAGHEYPVVRRDGGPFELLKDKHGFVIGGMEGLRYKEYELVLSPADKIFLYTDGVPEATNADQQMFGTERMIEALNTDADAAPQEALAAVRKAVNDFVGDAEQFDDLTMLCVEYKGQEEIK